MYVQKTEFEKDIEFGNLIETSVGALIIWIIRQTNTNIDNQTNKLQNLHALYCTLVLHILPEGPELSQLEDIKGRGLHRKVK